MTATHDRALLLAFCEWYDRYDDTAARGWGDVVDAFLAARVQPEAPCAHKHTATDVLGAVTGTGWHCKDCGARVGPCPHGSPPGECAECDGGSSPEMESDPIIRMKPLASRPATVTFHPAPPVERFWKLHEQDVGFGVNSNYQAMECDRHGVRVRDLGPMRFGRASRPAAEADGAASGLPEWRGGK